MDYTEKTLSSKHIFSGNIINVKQVTVSLPDGRLATRDLVLHPGAAAIVPINEKGEIYMVRQYRTAIDSITLEIPAGKLDGGEDPRLCAERELKEETGLTAENIIYLASVHSTPGFSNEVLHIYAATELHEGESQSDDDEFISAEKYHIDKLIDMIINGQITDAKSIIGIMLTERMYARRFEERR